MKGDESSDLKAFTDQNVSKDLAHPQFYREVLPKVGFQLNSYHDLTSHLTKYFQLMQHVVNEKEQELISNGVELERIEAYKESIEQRFTKVENREFAWGVFVGRKGEDTDSIKAAVKALEGRVKEQYDTEASMVFYKYIMGGGGDNMHYGIFRTGNEDLLTASHNTMSYIADLAAQHSALRTSSGSKMRVLDLGSGKGGTARFLAKTFGCHVTCMNLGENQNQYNRKKAAEDGISHLISVVTASFNEHLPSNWTGQFDMVWSQEALCHAANRSMVMMEVYRVLKPGGILVFSDLMRGEEVLELSRSNESGGAITAVLATPEDYTQAIKAAGLSLSVYRDLTANLATYFARTTRTVMQHRVPMLNAGVPQYRLEAYLNDLDNRLAAVQQRAYRWGAFVAKKPNIGKSPSSNLLLGNLSPSDTWVSVSSMMPDEKAPAFDAVVDDLSAFFCKNFADPESEDLQVGIFNSDEDTLESSSKNSQDFLIRIAKRVSPLMAVQAGSGHRVKVLILAAGKGTAARALAQQFGCYVTCLESAQELNDFNTKKATESGIGHLINVVTGSWTDPLPVAWTSNFDLVWGQEVFVDDTCIGEVFMEIERVLKEGGSAILSNLMNVGVRLDCPKPSLVQIRAAVEGVDMRMTQHLDLTSHLKKHLTVLSENVSSRKQDLKSKRQEQDDVDDYLGHIEFLLDDIEKNLLQWGVLVTYKSHYNKCLLVGAGPLGSFAAWRLAACGISDITAKILPTTPPGVKEMLQTAGCKLVTNWEDIEGTQYNIVMVATKTHWLARIAHEMTNFRISWDNLALIYNGYVKIPDFFDGDRTSSVVVPQSFSFYEESLAKGVSLTSIANGNKGNPWTFPPRLSSRVIVAQLKQAAVNATVSSTYEDDQFFKFCVNNSANLLAVITGRNCRDLTGKSDTNTIMVAILNETFNVLQGDSKFAGLVPLERDEYIRRVIGAVAAYSHHKPSSLQHYEQKRLADVAGLNGFISTMSRVTQVPAPVNEYIGRRADAMCRAHRRGICRETWESVTQLAAAMRLVEHMGMGNGIYGHATVRHPAETDKMLFSPFGNSFSEAHASHFKIVDLDIRRIAEEERELFDDTALRLHGAVYHSRQDVACILHTQSPYAAALVQSGDDINGAVMQDSMQFVGKTTRLAFPGHSDDPSEKLARAISDGEELPDIVFMGNLGVLVMGPDVATAFTRLYYLERCCQVQLLARSAGAKEAGPHGVEAIKGLHFIGRKKSAALEWEAHKRQLLKMPGEYAQPAYYE
eukprot:CAMPEP_0117667518 /NCGR_PEP_ID=MMETSP0804-20121206/11018_1 /TAXON_ID=1074897 /ORGANISM="Tetraselmis astigmatica, Strain CCMP880" /LENGTH=1261 /DNA_ID=CAMNT_0005475267 /DNA_START=149 /DNA_END=3934 /DNA_ORIENTATION=-